MTYRELVPGNMLTSKVVPWGGIRRTFIVVGVDRQKHDETVVTFWCCCKGVYTRTYNDHYEIKVFDVIA